jgi:hypothetical protein
MKGMYGHRNIDEELFKQWVLKWEEQDYIDYLRGIYKGNLQISNDRIKEMVRSIKELVKHLSGVDDGKLIDTVQMAMNPAMLYCYFRNGSNKLLIGNFHEVLLEASDYATHKKLLSGYDHDYLERGGIVIKNNGQIIGYIGEMSDLFWQTYFDEFVIQSENGDIKYSRNHDEEFTLQLWAVQNLEQNEMDNLIEKILYNCSVNLGLNFKRGKFDPCRKLKGNKNEFELELNNHVYELAPLLYFNFANDTSTSRHQYLSYYQVMEFYYRRAIKIAGLSRPNELAVITYIVNRAITKDEILSWLQSSDFLIRYYTIENAQYVSLVTLNLNDEELIDLVAKRIYYVRCSLVHAKEAMNIDDNFIPNMNDTVIDAEIRLVMFVAHRVMEYWNLMDQLQARE